MFLPLLAPVDDWSLHYERSGYVETGRYDEAVAYCRRLAKASPYAKVIEYGVSPQGRKMIALLVSRDRDFDAPRMRASKKPLVALESTLVAHGLPWPQNLDVARELEETVRMAGAVPATVAVIDGRPWIGLEDRILARVAHDGPDIAKAGATDLAIHLARGTTAAGPGGDSGRSSVCPRSAAGGSGAAGGIRAGAAGSATEGGVAAGGGAAGAGGVGAAGGCGKTRAGGAIIGAGAGVAGGRVRGKACAGTGVAVGGANPGAAAPDSTGADCEAGGGATAGVSRTGTGIRCGTGACEGR